MTAVFRPPLQRPTDRFVWSSSNPNVQSEQKLLAALPLPFVGQQGELIFTRGGLCGPAGKRSIRSSRREWSCHGWESVDGQPGVLACTVAALASLTITQAEFLCGRHRSQVSPQQTFPSTPRLPCRRRPLAGARLRQRPCDRAAARAIAPRPVRSRRGPCDRAAARGSHTLPGKAPRSRRVAGQFLFRKGGTRAITHGNSVAGKLLEGHHLRRVLRRRALGLASAGTVVCRGCFTRLQAS